MIGEQIGCYRFEEELHHGVRASVYKASHAQLGREVAIKMLHAHIPSGPEQLHQFHSEAKCCASVQHQNVLCLLDFGLVPDSNCPFLVMEYIDGRNLDQLLEAEKHIPLERALDVFIQTSDAMQFVNAAGVLHCDIKPAHIMLTNSTEQDRLVKLVGFGSARQSDAVQQQSPDERMSGGTPFYMSPERFTGADFDQRSDIYSFGCTMYEVLTGKTPFIADNVLEVMYKHMNEQPQPFLAIRPELESPEKIERIVMRCLAKDPSARYQSWSALHKDLSAFGSRTPSVKDKLQSLFGKLRRE